MSQLKRIEPSGQIALGKEFASRAAVVEEVEPGVWMFKLGQFGSYSYSVQRARGAKVFASG